MMTEVAIERLAALSYIIIGLSHLSRPNAWIRFFQHLHSRGEVGAIANGLVHLPLGLLIVVFHNAWQWPQIIVTVLGWALVIKGAGSFLFPQLALKSMSQINESAVTKSKLAGLVAIFLGSVIGIMTFA